MLYVNQLPEVEQRKISFKIIQVLVTEGYTNEQIKESIDDAMCSKYDDIKHLL